MSFNAELYYSSQYKRARDRADRAELILDHIAIAHQTNSVTKCCEQCGRPGPCFTLQLMEKR